MKIDPERGIWRFSRAVTTVFTMSLLLSEFDRLSRWIPIEFREVSEDGFAVLFGIVGGVLGLFFFRLSEKPRDTERPKP